MGDKGAQINAQCVKKKTPLHMACRRGHSCIVELLLSRGANVNAQRSNGMTPLHVALSEGREDIAKLLLTQRLEPNIQDGNGNTALHHYALKSLNSTEIKELLIAQGADISIPNKGLQKSTPIKSFFPYSLNCKNGLIMCQ